MQLLIGKKLGMTQIFEETGDATPVTVIQAGPCPIVQVKTLENDGYAAIQIGYGKTKKNRVTKALEGHFKQSGASPSRVLKEVRVEDSGQYKVGDILDVKIFEGAESVHIAGTTKGRGFAGTVKRHGFTIGPKTHGSKNIREPGSVGACATPARIYKGKRLPGRMGGTRTSVRNLKIVQIDAENHLIYVKGAIPGATNGIVFIRRG